MALTYISAESTVKPEELEVGKTTVYLRRNIVEEQRDSHIEGDSAITIYKYDEAKMTKDEALSYLGDRQISLAEDTDEFLIDHEYRLLQLELGVSDSTTTTSGEV